MTAANLCLDPEVCNWPSGRCVEPSRCKASTAATTGVEAVARAARYEWGVRYTRDPESWEPHRDGMDETTARAWVADFEADGGKVGAFVVIRRELGEWEAV